MGRKHLKPEQIIHMLREVCRELGISEQSY